MALPPAQQIPAQLEGRIAPVGGITHTAFVRGIGGGEWWIATLGVHADEIAPAAKG